MTPVVRNALAGLLVLTASAFAATERPAAPTLPQSAATRLVLDNGLVVLIEEDHSFPRVAFEVRVKGGSCDDTPWAGSGLAHLMEHMLFKGTEQRPVGTIEQAVRRYEGYFNAFTSYDYTGYSLSVGSAYAPEAVALLADVLFHSTFDPEELRKEQEVVRSEMKMNRDDPERRLHQRFWQTAFHVHPYRHPVIGYEEVFNRLHPEEILAFYRARYVPNNMVLAIVGDVETGHVRQWVEERLGSAPAGVPFDWFRPIEPPQLAARRHTEYFPVQQAQLMLGFHSTRLEDPDLYALDIVAQVLGAGESARLERRLRRQLGLVHAIAASNPTPHDPGLFIIAATVDAERADAALHATLEEIRAIRRDGITAEELARAKRQALAEFWRGRQSYTGRAGDLATNELLLGNHDFSRVYVQGIYGVRQDDVRRVARRYLTEHEWNLALLLPPEAPPQPTQPATAPAGLRITETQLANGLRVVINERPGAPLVSLCVMWRGGLLEESPAQAGLSHLTAQMLLAGTTRQTAEELARQVEARGGRLEAFSGKDGFGLVLDVLSDDASFGVELVRELMTQTAFPPEEFTREQQRTVARLRQRQDDIFEVMGDALRPLLMRGHPYARHPLGSLDSIERLTAKDCRDFFQRHGGTAHMVLAVAGDVRAEALLPVIRRAFDKLAPGDTAEAELPAIAFPDEPAQQVVRLPERQQAVVALGLPGVAWSDPDRYAFDVIQAVLSGSGGRLYRQIREQAGLSYTLGAWHVPGLAGGYLVCYVATTPQGLEQVTQTLRTELKALMERPPSEDEIELAKRALRNQYYEELQSVGAVASRLALYTLLGLGPQELEQYPDTLAQVSSADIQRVLQRLHTAAVAQLQVTPTHD